MPRGGHAHGHVGGYGGGRGYGGSRGWGGGHHGGWGGNHYHGGWGGARPVYNRPVYNRPVYNYPYRSTYPVTNYVAPCYDSYCPSYDPYLADPYYY